MIRALLAHLWPWAVKASPALIDATVEEICRMPTDQILIGSSRILAEPCDIPLKVRAAFVGLILAKTAQRERA